MARKISASEAAPAPDASRAAPPRNPIPGEAPSRAARSRPRRGFTLVEMIVAIALLIAAGALVLPPMLGQLGERAFDGATEDVRARLLLARAAAIREGVPVEVRYRPRTNRLEVVVFAPGAATGELEPAEEWPPPDDASSPFDATGVDAADRTPHLGSWAQHSLPDGLSLRATLPPELAEDLWIRGSVSTDELDAATEDARWSEVAPVAPDAGETFGEGELPLRVAVYLSDGSTLLSDGVYLVDEEGRASRVNVDRWTGFPRIDERIDLRLAAAAEEQEDEQEDEDETERTEEDEEPPAEDDVTTPPDPSEVPERPSTAGAGDEPSSPQGPTAPSDEDEEGSGA